MNISKHAQATLSYPVFGCTSAEKAYLTQSRPLEKQKARDTRAKAFYKLQCTAQAGDPQAQYELGKELAMSDDSADIAVYWLQKAAVQGVGEAFAELDDLDARQHQNVVTRMDRAQLYAEAAEALRKTAKTGDSAATVEYAVCCENGYGVKTDKFKASQLYVQQIKHGSTRAMVKFGDCYMNETGAKRDNKFAAQHYRKAAEHGDSAGIVKLLKCPGADLRNFKRGMTVFDRIKQAAELGDVDAQYQLGRYYSGGIGCVRDKKQARMWYERAAESGNINAMCALAELSFESGHVHKAAELFSKAAELGSAVGQRRLADCYYDEMGVETDLKRVVELYQKAAEQLDVPALRKLGLCYFDGIGVNKDVDKAAELFEQAAAAGDAESQMHIANCVLQGFPLRASKPDAIKMLEMAADKGLNEAASKLAECHENGIATASYSKETVESDYKSEQDECEDGMYMPHDTQQDEMPSDIDSGDAATAYRLDSNFEYSAVRYEQYERSATEILTQHDETETSEQCKAEARDGTETDMKLAKCYACGFTEPESDQEAFQVCKRVASQNDPDVLCAIGRAYQFGWGVEQNIAKAVRYYIKAADAGSFEAIKRLHDCWDKNIDGKLKTVFGHFKQLANTEDLTAVFNLAYCWYYGINCEANDDLAAIILQKAVDGGCSNAVVLMGRLYEDRYRSELDQTRVFELYKQAADAENKEGQFQTGWRYQHGFGVVKDICQAACWFEKAALQGHAIAACQLGVCYSDGCGVTCDLGKAYQYFKQAALAGNVLGQYMAGVCYMDGEGVTQNNEQAFYWLQKAVDQGHLGAMSRLGLCYQTGQGVAENVDKAIILYKAAAAQGIPSAQYYLANCYYAGCGVQQDYETAFELYKKATNKGLKLAFEGIGDVYYYGTGAKTDLTKAAAAYEQMDPPSQQCLLNLADCYQRGGVPGKGAKQAAKLRAQAKKMTK